MLFILGAVAGGLLAGALLGGSLGRLERVPLHRVQLIVAAVAVQTIATLLLGGVPYVAALLTSLVLATAFVVLNPHLAGRGLLILGLLLNALVVTVNGAMPVDRAAADRAGLSTRAIAEDARHTVAGSGTRLAFLGDRIALPLPWQPQVLSIGDILVAAGAGCLVVRAMRRGTRQPPPIVIRTAVTRSSRLP